MCKLRKALYGLKNDPRVWFSRLHKYLQQEAFKRSIVDSNLCVKISHGKIIRIEFYADDIIFGSDDDKISQDFAHNKKQEFKMSTLGELNFFLGIQIS